jgi:hypothetical protein
LFVNFLIPTLDDRYDQKCDVYSYTIIAWEVIARQTPYFHLGRPTAQQIMFGITGIAKGKTTISSDK